MKMQLCRGTEFDIRNFDGGHAGELFWATDTKKLLASQAEGVHPVLIEQGDFMLVVGMDGYVPPVTDSQIVDLSQQLKGTEETILNYKDTAEAQLFVSPSENKLFIAHSDGACPIRIEGTFIIVDVSNYPKGA